MSLPLSFLLASRLSAACTVLSIRYFQRATQAMRKKDIAWFQFSLPSMSESTS
jgi:hypothetical protein